MPNTSLTIYGDFSASVGGASSLSFTALSNIDCRKEISIGANTTFDGGSFTHTFRGDWVNNGTYTGSTSMCYFRGVGANLSGTGANNFYDLKFRAANITADANTPIDVSSHISAGWGGEFMHKDGGTLTMSGTNKTKRYFKGRLFMVMILIFIIW